MRKIALHKPVARFFLCSLAIGVLLGAMTLGKASAELVALWHFDEGSGEVVIDSSDNGNDGKFMSGEGEWVEGMVGDALQFRGTAQKGIIVEHNSSQAIKDLITVEAWIQPLGPMNYATVIRKGLYPEDWTKRTGWAIDTGGALGVRKFMYLKGGLKIIDGATTLKMEKWQHVAFTYDGKELKAYLNGEMYKTIAATGDQSECEEPIGIGMRPEGTTPFNGIIDEVTVWSEARTQEQIKEDMEGISTILVEASGKLSTTWSAIKTY